MNKLISIVITDLSLNIHDLKLQNKFHWELTVTFLEEGQPIPSFIRQRYAHLNVALRGVNEILTLHQIPLES